MAYPKFLSVAATVAVAGFASAASAAVTTVTFANSNVLGEAVITGGTAVNPLFTLTDIAAGSTITDINWNVTVDALTPANGSFVREAQFIIYSGLTPATPTVGIVVGFGSATAAPGIETLVDSVDLSEDFVDEDDLPTNAEFGPATGESIYLVLDDAFDDPFGSAAAPLLTDYILNGSLTVTYTAVPEPMSLGAVSLGGLCLLGRRRRA